MFVRCFGLPAVECQYLLADIAQLVEQFIRNE